MFHRCFSSSRISHEIIPTLATCIQTTHTSIVMSAATSGRSRFEWRSLANWPTLNRTRSKQRQKGHNTGETDNNNVPLRGELIVRFDSSRRSVCSTAETPLSKNALAVMLTAQNLVTKNRQTNHAKYTHFSRRTKSNLRHTKTSAPNYLTRSREIFEMSQRKTSAERTLCHKKFFFKQAYGKLHTYVYPVH